MISHLDMPPPDLPAGIQPMTFPEMLRNVTQHFENFGVSRSDAEERAAVAINHLLEGGYMSWWGLDEHGEPVYIPTVPRVTYVIVKEK